MDKKNIINFDAQGWPITQLNIRGIIEKICTYDAETQRYYVDANSKVLDLVPRVFEDDGMGYGVNEKRVCEFSIFGDKEQYCNIFVEETIDKIELWIDAKFYYGCFVKHDKTRYITKDIRKNEDDVYEYLCVKYTHPKGFIGEQKWISEDKLEYD